METGVGFEREVGVGEVGDVDLVLVEVGCERSGWWWWGFVSVDGDAGGEGGGGCKKECCDNFVYEE